MENQKKYPLQLMIRNMRGIKISVLLKSSFAIYLSHVLLEMNRLATPTTSVSQEAVNDRGMVPKSCGFMMRVLTHVWKKILAEVTLTSGLKHCNEEQSG